MTFDSESSSSTSNTQQTTQIDDRVAATDDAVVLQLDGGASIQLTDPGLIDAAGAALDKFGEVFEASLAFSKDTADRSFAFADAALVEARSDESKGLREVLIAGAVVAVAAVAFPQIAKIVKG